MKHTLELIHPLKICGQTLEALDYDAEEITVDAFIEAEAMAGKQMQKSGAMTVKMAEMDSVMHLYVGMQAIRAVSPEIDFADLERLRGKDIFEVVKIGRNFIVAQEESEGGDSEERSEDTPALLAPV